MARGLSRRGPIARGGRRGECVAGFGHLCAAAADLPPDPPRTCVEIAQDFGGDSHVRGVVPLSHGTRLHRRDIRGKNSVTQSGDRTPRAATVTRQFPAWRAGKPAALTGRPERRRVRSVMLRLPSFSYLQPKTLTEALAMKRDAGPDGMFVAGGTDLYPNMKRRHQEPKTVISLMGIPELGRLDGRTVGPCVTLSALSDSPTVRQSYGVVSHAARLVSTPLLRNMGTLGGNLCLDTRCNYYNQSYEWRKSIDFCMKKDGHICWVAPSSPRCWAVSSSDVAPVMVAIGAEYRLVGPSPAAERVVPAARFYHNDGINYLTKQPDEILAAVRLPPPDGWDAVYHKLRRRGSFDFPVLGVAAWVKWQRGSRNAERETVAEARIVLGGVASWPQEMPEAAAALAGTALEDAAIAAAAEAAYRPAKPLDNTDFDLSWRKQMTRVYVTRALEELRRRR